MLHKKVGGQSPPGFDELVMDLIIYDVYTLHSLSMLKSRDVPART